MPEEVKKEALRELDRLSKIPAAAAEYTVARTYLDWLVALPWAKRTDEVIDLIKTKQVLDADHSGLERLKDRIVEYLAVRKLKPDVKGPILCFVGPPGVGKTSLAKSIATALGRKVVRVSLGGMRDEAEIRGPPAHVHRRAAGPDHPGPAACGVEESGVHPRRDRQARRDFRGDPASALLEVLDPEQNNTFAITTSTCRSICRRCSSSRPPTCSDTIPGPLRDRMEVLELAGYTEEEKLRIARDHLVARQIANHGLATDSVTFTDPAISAIIRGYTREAGVRNLEREIGSICRKIARRQAEGHTAPIEVTPEIVAELLGAPRHLDEEIKGRTREPGVAVGLAWTPVGGDVLFVEASRLPGASQLTITGQLGDVMKESARIALSWFRANAARFGVEPTFYKDAELHMHVPAWCDPEGRPVGRRDHGDGPGLGTFGEPVKPDLAMTGEITLSGRVLPVGGIKEKVLAARRMGIKEVILPRQNEKNIVEDLTPLQRQDPDRATTWTRWMKCSSWRSPDSPPRRRSSGGRIRPRDEPRARFSLA
jgi:ATP-dependent Lon protease